MKKPVLIAVLLAAILASGVFAASCGEKSETPSATPKQVVDSWLNNLLNGNWNATYDALTSEDQAKITREQWVETYSEQGKPPSDAEFVITGQEINGDKATVNVTITQGDQKQSGSIPLVKEGDTWKVSASASAQTE